MNDELASSTVKEIHIVDNNKDQVDAVLNSAQHQEFNAKLILTNRYTQNTTLRNNIKSDLLFFKLNKDNNPYSPSLRNAAFDPAIPALPASKLDESQERASVGSDDSKDKDKKSSKPVFQQLKGIIKKIPGVGKGVGKENETADNSSSEEIRQRVFS